MSISLYRIDEQYKKAFQDLESMDDMTPEIIEDSLAEMKGELEAKCLAVAAFIKNLDAEAKAVKDAADTLNARKRAIDNKASRMREYLAAHLPSKLSNDQVVITPLKGRKKIVVFNEELLPDSCFKTTKSIVAAEVKKSLGDLPEGAAGEVTGPASVMIK